MESNHHNYELSFGFYSSIILTITTIITFGLAMMAIPPAGPYCPENCMEYPYHGSLEYYPRDFYWMYAAMIQITAYLVVMISIHFASPKEKKISSFISLTFALVAATILWMDYFIQFAVIPVSLMEGETDGIALITQYNGHGIFIALEELGYIMMSLSLIFTAPVFSCKILLERMLRWTFVIAFLIVFFSFIFYILKFGIERSYRFEVAAITINWFALIIGGAILILYFRKLIKISNTIH